MEPELRAIPGMISMRSLRRSIASELEAHGHAAKSKALLAEILASYDVMPADSAAMPQAKVGRAVTLSALGRHAEAYALAKEALGRDTSLGGAFQVGLLAAYAGDREAAMKADARLAAQPTQYRKGALQLLRARIAAALGDRARAVALLRQAQHEGLTVHLNAHNVPELRLLKGDAEFDELVKSRG